MHQQGIEGSAGERTPAVGTWPSAARTVLGWQEGGFFFFGLAGCDGSPGYWQSLTKRELKKQHQRYCVSEKSQAPIPL